MNNESSDTEDASATPQETSPAKAKPQSAAFLIRMRGWLIAIAGFLIIFVPLFFAVSALGSRLGLWDWRFGFGTLTRNIGPKLLLLLLGTGLISLLLAFFLKPRKGLFVSVVAVLTALGAMGYAQSISAKAQRLPLIHDISTDTQDPPSFTDAIIAERAKTEGVNSVERAEKKEPRSGDILSVAQVKAYPDIRSLIRSEDPAGLAAKAIETAKALGWIVVTEDISQGIIEATDTTFWFGFKDDIVIRIRPGEGGGSVMDIRSVSRVGLSDVGANAERIRRFSKHL